MMSSSRSRKTKNAYKAGALAAVFVAAIVIILINVSADYFYFRKDLTRSGKYSVSEATLKQLSRMSARFELAAFLRKTDEDFHRVRQICESICSESPLLSYTVIDPDREPGQAEKYSCSSYKVLIVRNLDTKKQEKIYSINEERIVNALIKLGRSVEKVVYFTKGHGERDLFSRDSKGYYELTSMFQQRGFSVDSISLASVSEIPENCTFLVIAGAQTAPLPGEMKLIRSYIETGGRALFLLDPSPGYGFQQELKKYGFLIHDNLIKDKSSEYFGSTPTVIMVNTYGSHNTVEGLKLSTTFSGVREIEFLGILPENFLCEIIAKTSPGAVSEVITPVPHPLKGEKDLFGIAGVMSAKLAHREGEPARDYRVIVTGDADFCSNYYLNMEGNHIFTLNLVNWLADEGDIISVGQRKKSLHLHHLTVTQLRSVFIITVIVFPALSILTGILVFVRRRN